MLLRRRIVSPCATAHAESAARTIGVSRVIGAAVVQRVVENFHCAGAGAAGVRDPRQINAGESAAAIFRIGHANVVDHVVISFHRALAGIDGGKVYSVAAIAMDQIVMNMEIELIVASLVTCCRSPAGIAATNGTAPRGTSNCHEYGSSPRQCGWSQC